MTDPEGRTIEMNHQTEMAKEEVNWLKVEKYLRNSIEHLPDSEMSVQQFSEGYSNLTYLLKIGDWEGVLRRPPFGKVPPKAHDMEREYRILEKVHPVFSLAPKPYVYSEDPKVMDKHFYVMEKKPGIVIDDKLPSLYGSSIQAGPAISEGIISTLVQLQAIDYKEAGMSGMGKPEGFLERQVNGWIKRYENSKTDEIGYIAELEKWLKNELPTTKETTIVHNDFKLNNMVLDEQTPGVVNGVLDWELSTIGDPLSDLGSTVAYWGAKSDPNMGINIVTDQPGFYSRREFVEAYAKKSGRDVSDINYYVTFGFYKLGVILQQIHYRWKIGELKDDRFAEMDVPIENLFAMANDARAGRLL